MQPSLADLYLVQSSLELCHWLHTALLGVVLTLALQHHKLLRLSPV